MPAKILIVDDDLQSLKLVGLMLQRRGHTIVAAQGGLQALAKAESEQPDLVLLDIMMDDLDGYEVCRRLRSNPVTRDLSIIMFTAKTMVSDKVAGFQAGADDYLTKPIHPTELATRVDAVLQRHRQAQTEVETQDVERIVGFLGVTGGVGTTPLALNVAAAVASTPPPRRVILADLQPGAANVALQLQVDPGLGLGALLNHSPHEIDRALVSQHLIHHPSGIRLLLPGLELRSGLSSLPAAQLTAIIESLIQIGQIVILDLGSTVDEGVIAALKLCRQVVLALEPQRVAVNVARNLIAQLDRRGIPPERLIVTLINRTQSTLTLDKRAIENALKLPVGSLIPPAPETAFHAAEQAALIIHLQPGSLIADQFRSLAQRLTA